MDLSKLKSPPIPATYTRGDETLNLMVDADMLTPQFLDEMAQLETVVDNLAKKPAKKKDQRQTGDIASQVSQFGFFVNVLSRTIVAWDLTDKGKAVPVSVDVLRTFSLVLLTDLFEVCMEAGTPKKTTERQSEDTTSPAAG